MEQELHSLITHLGLRARQLNDTGDSLARVNSVLALQSEAIALLRRIVDRDVTFIDTADSYGPGISETLIAKARHPYPADLVGDKGRPDVVRCQPLGH